MPASSRAPARRLGAVGQACGPPSLGLSQDQRRRQRTPEDQRGVEHRRPRTGRPEGAQVGAIEDAAAGDDVQVRPDASMVAVSRVTVSSARGRRRAPLTPALAVAIGDRLGQVLVATTARTPVSPKTSTRPCSCVVGQIGADLDPERQPRMAGQRAAERSRQLGRLGAAGSSSVLGHERLSVSQEGPASSPPKRVARRMPRPRSTSTTAAGRGRSTPGLVARLRPHVRGQLMRHAARGRRRRRGRRGCAGRRGSASSRAGVAPQRPARVAEARMARERAELDRPTSAAADRQPGTMLRCRAHGRQGRLPRRRSHRP